MPIYRVKVINRIEYKINDDSKWFVKLINLKFV